MNEYSEQERQNGDFGSQTASFVHSTAFAENSDPTVQPGRRHELGYFQLFFWNELFERIAAESHQYATKENLN